MSWRERSFANRSKRQDICTLPSNCQPKEREDEPQARRLALGLQQQEDYGVEYEHPPKERVREKKKKNSSKKKKIYDSLIIAYYKLELGRLLNLLDLIS